MSARTDLDSLEADIDSLEAELIDAQRRTGDLVDGEAAQQLADAEVFIAKTRLDLRYRTYFKLARSERHAQCRVHGAAILVSCPECAECHPSIRTSHAAYNRAVLVSDTEEHGERLVHDITGTIAAVEEGRAHDVAPCTTLRILKASRRTG